MSKLDLTVQEVFQIFNYLRISLDHAEKLMGIATNYYCDSNDVEKPISNLNEEAVSELMFLTKKISSKSDILQNKVLEFSKIIYK